MQLSSIVFGAMRLPDQPRELRARLIHSAIDHGITSFDTAPLYGAGESERILGQALSGRRHRVLLLTKCGLRWDSSHGQAMFEMAVDGKMRTVRKDSRTPSIRAGLDASLRNLRTEVIDLLQVHQLDERAPIEDTMLELDRALSAGKIRAVGVSNYPTRALHRAHAALRNGLFSTQSPLSLANMSALTELLPAVRALGIRFLAYEPLARGLLAGKSFSKAEAVPHASAAAHAALKNVVLPIAEERSLTAAQVALAWLLAQSGVTAVVAGFSSEKQVAENSAAANLRLEPSLVARLTEAFAKCQYDREPELGLASRLERYARRFKHAVARRLASSS